MTSYQAQLAGLHKVLQALVKTNLNKKKLSFSEIVKVQWTYSMSQKIGASI